jgi:hypothetical protein
LIKTRRRVRTIFDIRRPSMMFCPDCLERAEQKLKEYSEQAFSERPGHLWRVKDGKVVYKEDDVIEESIGRNLTITEQVVHKNGNILDNRLSNLEIVRIEKWEGQ